MTVLAQHRVDSVTRDALAVLQPGFVGTEPPAWLLRSLDEGLASVALFGRNVQDPEQLARLTARLRAERDDVLVAIDEEGGDVTRLEVHTGSSFPGNLALGAVDDTELTRQVAHALALRLAECGINFNWAPSADVNSNPDNPVIGVRSFGADTGLTARHTAAYVTGMQAAGVAVCTKHFPGHGDTNVDSHEALPRIDVDLDTLAARELVPFKAAIAADTKAIMSAHILVPALDATRPATVSPLILTDLLRRELGYEGLIVTDGIEMNAIAGTYGIERGTVLAIAAGADAICVGGGHSDEGTVLRLRDALVSAVREGTLSEQRLADAAARVRSLAEWTRATRVEAAPGASEEGNAPGIGLVAARRALRVTGAPLAPIAEPFVATLDSVSNFAVGAETPWGIAADLAELLPGTLAETFGESAKAEEIRAAAGERTLVIAARDIHRHAWMGALVDELVAARPDTVVVELGLPGAEPAGALHIATHGASRVCGRAAAEYIAGVR
ncbi:glycoside hydrolase family 3 protein [Streptomyces sp. BI20]|uniref:glycoside hydrolase family 3 protein n=1 Tax=Streptomyces sp. BI20 TaxID=3403460 RepID=UPI003C72222E